MPGKGVRLLSMGDAEALQGLPRGFTTLDPPAPNATRDRSRRWKLLGNAAREPPHHPPRFGPLPRAADIPVPAPQVSVPVGAWLGDRLASPRAHRCDTPVTPRPARACAHSPPSRLQVRRARWGVCICARRAMATHGVQRRLWHARGQGNQPGKPVLCGVREAVGPRGRGVKSHSRLDA